MSTSSANPLIEVSGLTMAYGDLTVQRDLSFTVQRGSVFMIMGGSGCGKSTLLRHLIGLQQPVSGMISYEGTPLLDSEGAPREQILRRIGVLFQSGALWSSMTLAENIAVPLQTWTDLPPADIAERVSLKLALVGLAGLEEAYPAQLSGGMRKRAGLARAMALDPDILFFDEPSAGLDPVNARHLDDLMIELRDSLGTTLVVVTHELPSLFAIGTDAVFLDAKKKTITARGRPADLLHQSDDPDVQAFLRRGVL